MSTPTEITVRPTTSASLSRPEKPIFGVYTPGDTDTISLSGIASALNPLHHIPFVSQVYEASTGDSGPAVGKLIGGALLGGPVGFLISLAGVIFEQETGKSITTAVASAFTGEESATQVAKADTAVDSIETASLVGVTPGQEILPPEQVSSAQAAQIVASTQSGMASTISQEDSDVLSLFGGQQASAHKSYQQAQMLPYLNDVSTSLVM